ncbi:MAG: regulatory iron-sulfur-containing complex subunit RicT [Gemmatimonadota bacterium]|nr:regulatory iron-sulfur-containing complex subunit RicT [Gemmatimonadota bacterium]MDQ8166197.1 regulatory iron-sulfur-containing complex subunit RicT [Gemmatimonadota bacterium]MDQ8172968.1 regulatory iron-sulfur-containing complex subunit RicT [Gemmatimonadota bacterium]
MAHLIEVAFRGNRKEFFTWTGETAPPLKAGVIVEADRGEDFGRVHSTGELAEVRCNGCAHGCGTTPPPRVALRLATKADEQFDRELTAENEAARRTSMERVKANGLVMKLTDAEWQWDRRKLTLFFTAERRVDFRGLVRDLAAQFRTRIELKQIGVRDEAKRLSGVGRCGREYCSASWLPDLRPVNLGVAKDQKLSLNPQQISGACGRLMCCLRYEHEFYVLSRRKFPKEGKILTTSLGEEKVISCDIFNERVTLRTAEGDSRVITLAELRREVDGLDQPTEPIADTVTDDLRASTVDDHADAHADPAVRAMLDTVEIEIATLMEIAPGAVTPGAVTPATVAPVTAEPSIDIGVTETAAESAAEATRRKRRRGRRGGRRLRAAEERRQTDPTGTAPSGDGEDDDSDDTEE